MQFARTSLPLGSIVRAVGNNLDDDTGNDIPYQIGFDGSRVLADGGSDGMLRVAPGVTLMIDAGAIFKLGSGSILVGSTSGSENNQAASIQVLGTPDRPALFTSARDEAIGRDVTVDPTSPARGDWGGLQIRNDYDAAAGRFNYEDQGIFLNYISNADVRYGGGLVSINAISQVTNPISLINVRPTIIQNSITVSADAAMAATPNSFVETTFAEPQFQSTPFTPDYHRVGPDIRGNVLTGNTTNAMIVERLRSVPSPRTPFLRRIVSTIPASYTC